VEVDEDEDEDEDAFHASGWPNGGGPHFGQ